MSDILQEASERKKRTDQQRRALEVWCREVADTLNNHGIDHQAVYAVRQVSLPWCQETVKAELFRPICNALTQGDSTADADTRTYDRVHTVLSKHIAENFGVTLPAWPSWFNQGDQ